MSSTYTIRRAATDADYGAIRKIHVDLFVGGYKEVPCLDRGTWWVVTVGKDVVGFAGLYRSSIRRGTAYLCRCGVLTAHQGTPLPKRLVAMLGECRSRAAKYAVVVLKSLPSRAAGVGHDPKPLPLVIGSCVSC